VTGRVIAFPEPATATARQNLLWAVMELHALITLDPILGVSPARTYFVLNPHAKARIVAALPPADRRAAAGAYALLAYDFPFALCQLKATTIHLPGERARAIVTKSADLQAESFGRAAAALDMDARRIAHFDAAALKASFFPSTQETVTQVFRLSLNPA
jgi:3-hydroxypropanoate dehydrogenase